MNENASCLVGECSLSEFKERYGVELKEHEQNEQLFGRKPKADLVNLREGIKCEGILHPLLVNKDGVILDGNHRWIIAQELGITDVRVLVFDIKPEDQARFMIESNLNTKSLNTQESKLIMASYL